MASGIIGWDIGGAHVKAAYLDDDGSVLAVVQEACPLWRGIGELERAVPAALASLGAPAHCRHAATMTGELVDAFADRHDGVRAIVAALVQLAGAELSVFAGPLGLLEARCLRAEHYDAVASANWLASAAYLSTAIPAALLVDIGSTTTDILPISGGAARHLGYSDFERLKQEEMVYTGVVRTPVMAVADRAPFDGAMIPLAAEYFASMADAYRLLAQLSPHADPWPTADGGDKDEAGSARRLARMLGRDLGEEGAIAWRSVAAFLRERQLQKILTAILRQLSRVSLEASAPLVGAGVGRFLVEELARRLARPYRDMDEFLGTAAKAGAVSVADVAPAVAVAKLARRMSL